MGLMIGDIQGHILNPIHHLLSPFNGGMGGGGGGGGGLQSLTDCTIGKTKNTIDKTIVAQFDVLIGKRFTQSC